MASQQVLTVAIPNKNGATFLNKTLESLALNRPHVRWWFQDAGSTDMSVAIAQTFRGPLDSICIEPDNGQADGINRAISAMGGEIICYLNSDDCLVPGAAQLVLNTFAECPDVDLVYGDIEIIDANGCVERVHSGCIESYDDIVDIYNIWWKGKQWVQPEVFWRRRLWDVIGPFNNDLTLAFDFEYWVRCFRQGCRVQHIPQVLSQFRLHPSQKSSNSKLAAQEIRATVHASLRSHSLHDAVRGKHLRKMLAYDCFQNREAFGSVPPDLSFASALLHNPCWVTLPAVRSRIRQSVGKRLRPLSSGKDSSGDL